MELTKSELRRLRRIRKMRKPWTFLAMWLVFSLLWGLLGWRAYHGACSIARNAGFDKPRLLDDRIPRLPSEQDPKFPQALNIQIRLKTARTRLLIAFAWLLAAIWQYQATRDRNLILKLAPEQQWEGKTDEPHAGHWQ
jgi:hypothetical protein